MPHWRRVRLLKPTVVLCVIAGLASCGTAHKIDPVRTVPQTGALKELIIGGGDGGRFGPRYGVLVGALAKSSVGARLPIVDRRLSRDAEYRALEYGTTGKGVAWKNAASGAHGEVVPGVNFVDRGRTCRRYTHRVRFAGMAERVSGTACRNPNGSWVVPLSHETGGTGPT